MELQTLSAVSTRYDTCSKPAVGSFLVHLLNSVNF